MKINDIKKDMKSVNIVGKVKEKGEIKEFEKYGQTQRVCTVKIEDDSGSIELSLWGDDIERIRIGDFVHIEKGYIKEYMGALQMHVGRYGKIEIVEDEYGTTKI